MHSLFKKLTVLGLAGMLAVGLVAFPGTARQVDAQGGYAISSVAANNDEQSVIESNVLGSVLSVSKLPPPPAGVTKFIGPKASWKYFAHRSAPSTNWLKVGFNGSGWKNGAAPFGYGNASGDQKTKVAFGGNKDNRFISTYFRRVFTIKNPSQVKTLTLQVLHDDGAIVYLNGTVLAHPNMSTNEPSYDTLASACNSSVIETYEMSPSLLLTGKNVVEVEVHQCAKNSANMIFNASLYGQTNTSKPKPAAVPTKKPTASPKPTARPAPSNGSLPAAPSGQKWSLRWGDEFNGSSVDTSKWKINNLTRPEDPNKTWYIPQNVSELNGTLKLQVKKQSYNGASYTGGMLELTGNYRRNLYGYYEARIKYNFVGPGFWGNFWMCGVDRWPPEIDNEIVTHHSGAVYLANHYRDSAGVHKSTNQYASMNYNQWHTYGVLWLPGKPVQFYVDGKLSFTASSPTENPPNIDMYVSLRAGAYNSASWGGIPNSTTKYPGMAEYDYVHVYQAVKQ